MKNKHYLWQICIAAILGSLFFNIGAVSAADIDIDGGFDTNGVSDYIRANFDKNSDGILQDAERLAIQNIDISGISTKVSIDVNLFPNLLSFNAYDVAFTSNPFTGTPKIQHIDIEYYAAGGEGTFELPELPELKHFRMSSSKFIFSPVKYPKLEFMDVETLMPAKIDLSRHGALRVAKIWPKSSPTELIFAQNPNLEELSVHPSSSDKIKIDQLTGLKKLDLNSWNPIKVAFPDISRLESLTVVNVGLDNVDLTQAKELTELKAESVRTKNVDLSKCSKLQYLYLREFGMPGSFILGDYPELLEIGLSGDVVVGDLDISASPKLEYLYTSGTIDQEALDLSKNTKLNHLEFRGGNLPSLDLSNNKALTFIRVHNVRLRNITLPEGAPVETLSLSHNLLSNIDLSPLDLSRVSADFYQNSLIAFDGHHRVKRCIPPAQYVEGAADNRENCILSPNYVYSRSGIIGAKDIQNFDPARIKSMIGATYEDSKLKIAGLSGDMGSYPNSNIQMECRRAIYELGLDPDTINFKCSVMEYDNGIDGKEDINRVFLISSPDFDFDSYPDIPEPVEPTPQLPLNPETLDKIEHYAPIALIALAVAVLGMRRLMRRH